MSDTILFISGMIMSVGGLTALHYATKRLNRATEFYKKSTDRLNLAIEMNNETIAMRDAMLNEAHHDDNQRPS